jgi:hypothetical protein
MLTLTALVASAVLAQAPAPNTLTAAEQAAGWTLLFDGTSTDHWTGYKQPAFPTKGWVIEDGCIKIGKGGGAGDIVTKAQYSDFEFSCEFKVDKGANSGIIYRVSPTKDATYMTGPEFQILDDSGHKDGADPKHRVGALYDLIAAPADKPTRPVGEFNEARIRIKDGVLEHFLNGRRVVHTRIDTPDWNKLIAGSKFKGWDGFGVQPAGHIALQDHGDNVWFRNIKVRDLTKPMPSEVNLLDGCCTKGWTAFVPELADQGKDPLDVWELKDGVLICSGTPAGYIRTDERYTNYVLQLDWRFSPVTKQAGNSGVLLRVQEPDKVWPTSIEAQLHSGNAGDFWNIGEFPMQTDKARTNGRNTKKLRANENSVGEWNRYEITVNRGDVILMVNGEVLNHATNAQEIPGFIALQSEGAEIHFRNIRLAPIP